MQHQDLTIGFIGGGNMAQAIIAGLLRAGHSPLNIVAAEPAAPARLRLAALSPALRLADSAAAVAAVAEVLVLAVKPQVMPAILAELSTAPARPGQTVVSVAAGMNMRRIAAALRGAPVVRVMPNQPALVGAGMSVLVTSPTTGAGDRGRAEYVARAAGDALWIDDENLMDAVTAVSGSGPAYFYLLMEVMEATARELGLPADVAQQMVRQTALGAALSAGSPGAELVALRSSVTSPGGTTAAALAVMDEAGLRDTLRRAIIAACERGAALGRGTG